MTDRFTWLIVAILSMTLAATLWTAVQVLHNDHTHAPTETIDGFFKRFQCTWNRNGFRAKP